MVLLWCGIFDCYLLCYDTLLLARRPAMGRYLGWCTGYSEAQAAVSAEHGEYAMGMDRILSQFCKEQSNHLLPRAPVAYVFISDSFQIYSER
jgi:hypothetical protein